MRLPELDLPRARCPPRRHRTLRDPRDAPDTSDNRTRRGDKARETRTRDRVRDPQRGDIVEEEDPRRIEAVSCGGANVLCDGEGRGPGGDLFPLRVFLVLFPLGASFGILAVGV